MKNVNKQNVLIAALACLPVSAMAHGPQMQIAIENNLIVPRAIFLDGPYDAPTPGQRLFQINMAQRALGDAQDGWYAQPSAASRFTGPGIATEIGGFATGSVISMTFADGLKIWNGAAFVDPGTEQIDAYRGNPKTVGAITSDSGPFNSFSFAAITNTGDEHGTARFRLLGDGVAPNTASDDGVYLLALRLTTTQAGVAPSEPYYFLLNKNGSAQDQSAALAAATALVPEPGALSFVLLGGVALLVRRRGPFAATSPTALRSPRADRPRTSSSPRSTTP